MQIYLNLLPEDRKEKIKSKRLFRAAVLQEIKLLFPLIFFLLVLATINYNLKIQLEAVENFYSEKNSQDQYREMKSYEEKFKEINQRVISLSDFYKKHLHWSNLLVEFTNLVPDNIYLTSLVTKDYQLLITGKAKNRNDLLVFQDKLKNSKCFIEVEMPLSNLISKENVDFQIDLKIKSECLK